jgi:heavy metal sensor kinase
MRWIPQNVRARLTLWYVLILAVLLLLYGAGSSAILFLQLRSQLSHRAIEDLETVEGVLTVDASGKVLLRSDYHDHPYPETMQDRLLEVWSPGGTLLYRNELLGSRSLGPPPASTEGLNSYGERSLRLADGTPVRLVSKRHSIDGHPTVIRVGFSEQPLHEQLWQMITGLIAGLPVALGLAGFLGYFLASRALGPVDRMARRVREINAERLSARVEVENPHDELGRLATAFNETLARLERSFEQLRRFTSDASHELRTPLTAIRSVGEVGLRGASGAEHYRDVIGSMLEETARLTSLVESLLTISRADSGQIRLAQVSVALLPLVREVVSFVEILAEEKRHDLSVHGDESLHTDVDPAILKQVLVNLLDNAIKYTPEGGRIVARVLAAENGWLCVEVEDNGPGIPPVHRDRVFDRFYRIDEARSRSDGGAGLGLAIAQWGAEAHGGFLRLDSSPGGGCIFRLTLPQSKGAQSARNTPSAKIVAVHPS